MPRPEHFRLPAWARVLRPEQWIKNCLVPAAFLFAFFDKAQGVSAGWLAYFLKAAAAFVLFCGVSSGVYIFNDIVDREADARHPAKRFRPIAAGEISPASARIGATLLVVASLALSWLLSRPFAGLVAVYLVLQGCYSLALKRIPILDVIVIAAGFVLRAVAGAAAINVAISAWLLVCTFFLSLFLALCKRRQEKTTRAEDEQRHSVKEYSVQLLDILIGVSSSLAIVSYSLYTLWPATVRKFGTPLLGLTIPFVVVGIFRYMHLVYVHEQGERPERTLLADRAIIVTVALYLASVAAIMVLS